MDLEDKQNLIVLAGISVLLWSLSSAEKKPTETSGHPSPSVAAPATVSEPFEPGPWTFDSIWSLPLDHAHGLASGDIDGDGIAEILVSRHSSVEILKQDGESKGTLKLDADITQVSVGRGVVGPVLLSPEGLLVVSLEDDQVAAYSAKSG